MAAAVAVADQELSLVDAEGFQSQASELAMGR